MTAGMLPSRRLGLPRRLRGRGLWLGAVLVGLGVLVALVSLVWTPHDPLAIHPFDRLAGSSLAHPLGTDALGRDVLSQVMAGARLPLLVATCAVAISLLLGVSWGVGAAMTERSGRGLGVWMMRWNDVAQAFPPLLLAVVLAAALGGGGTTAALALGIGAAPGMARVVRAATLQILTREYIPAARAAGRPALSIALRHVLPNVSGVVAVQASIGFALAILAEAALSYLGLGTAAPTPSWGRMLQEGQAFLGIAPGLVVWPGLAIAVTVLGFTLLGDGLRDSGDPREER